MLCYNLIITPILQLREKLFFRLPFVSSAVLYYSWLLEVVTAPSDCYVKERKAQQGYLPSVVYLSYVIKAGRSTVHIFSVLLVLN